MILDKLSGNIETILVDVPNIHKDAQIIVRQNTIADVFKFHNIVKDRSDENGNMPQDDFIMARLVCSMVADDGSYIAEPEQIDELLGKVKGKKGLDGKTITDLYAAYDKLNPATTAEIASEKKSKS